VRGVNLPRFDAAALRLGVAPVAGCRQLGMVADGLSDFFTVRLGFVGDLLIGRLALVAGLAFVALARGLGERQPGDSQGRHNENGQGNAKRHDSPLADKQFVVAEDLIRIHVAGVSDSCSRRLPNPRGTELTGPKGYMLGGAGNVPCSAKKKTAVRQKKPSPPS